MKEEKASYGFTMVSNEFLDEKLSKIKSFSELKVVLAVMRKTIGYQKQSDQISISQFQTLTGLSRQGVIDGMESAIQNRLIERISKGQYFIYSLKLVNDLDQLDFETSQRFRPVLVNDLDQLSPKLVNDLDTQKKGLNKTINKGGGDTAAIAPDPQKSMTIDLVETCPINQEVLPYSKEPTSRPPASRQEPRQTYPATLPPATDKKVKGVSVAGGVEKGKPKLEKLRDEKLDHPAVQAYQKKFKLTPDESQRDLIVTQITDLGEWGEALDYWKDNKYRPLSVGKLVDCYCKGSYKNELPGNRNDRGTGMGSVGSTRPVAAHGASFSNKRTAEELEREWADFRLP
jgi:phage replication O-like protein O